MSESALSEYVKADANGVLTALSEVALAIRSSADSLDLVVLQDDRLSFQPVTSHSHADIDALIDGKLVNVRDGGKIMNVLVIANPAAGAGQAVSLAKSAVVPLLERCGCAVRLVETTSAEQVRRDVVSWTQEYDSLVALGGDGLLHDIVNGLAERNVSASALRLALVPCGTANALYAHLYPPESSTLSEAQRRLQGVISLIKGSTEQLPIMRCDLPGSRIRTTVVTSLALHAAILHNAEKLRASIPGLDRFKVAAQQSATTWWRGKIDFVAADTLKYSPKTKNLQPAVATELSIEGYFSYIACAVTSRFEPSFVIAPLRKGTNKGLGQTFDVVIVRPRGKKDTLDSTTATEDERNAYVPMLWKVLTSAYEQGAHIDSTDEHGEPIVEYYRTSSLTWRPVIEESEETSGLVCCDGDLHRLKSGESVTVTAEDDPSIRIYW